MKQPSGADVDAGGRRRWQVLAVTAVAVFMSFLDVTIVNIAFPDLRADFVTTSLPTLSWVINGYGVVFAAALALSPTAVARGTLAALGRRPTALPGLLSRVLKDVLAPLPRRARVRIMGSVMAG